MDDAGQILTNREIPAKSLKTPTTVSPELQRSIAGMAAAAAAGGGLPAGWAPGNAAEWKAIIAQMDVQALSVAPAIKAMFPHTSELRQIAGVTVREITPSTFDPARAGKILVHFHGGGYALNGGEASTGEAVLGAHYSRLKVISVDYRMPPDHPFPAAVDDALAVWRALRTDRAAAAMGAFGTSAGGGLTLALALKLKDLREDLPGALALGTPWADLTGASDSYQVNAHVDGIFSNFDGFGKAMAALYAGEAGVTHPLVSPVFGEFSGFPPTVFVTGTRDILLSDTVRVYRAMRAAGVTARLEVHEAMSHAEYIYAFDAPESAVAFRDVAAFFDEHLAG